MLYWDMGTEVGAEVGADVGAEVGVGNGVLRPDVDKVDICGVTGACSVSCFTLEACPGEFLFWLASRRRLGMSLTF